MKKVFFIQLLCCIFALGAMLYSYINLQNNLTSHRLQLPTLTKQVDILHEENARLNFEIERFIDPKHLIKLAKHTNYSHLRFQSSSMLKHIAKSEQKRILPVNDPVLLATNP